jgi:hypothetical protein
LGCCILYVDILYVLWTFIHCQTYDLKIFFPILSVVFLPCWHYPSMSQILKVLMKSSLSCFLLPVSLVSFLRCGYQIHCHKILSCFVLRLW